MPSLLAFVLLLFHNFATVFVGYESTVSIERGSFFCEQNGSGSEPVLASLLLNADAFAPELEGLD